MPTYEYACRDCGEHLEVVQSFKDSALTDCPNCGGSLRKVFSAAGIIFKGSGWHIKDYGTSRSGSTKPAEGAASEATDSSGKASSDEAGSGGGKKDATKKDATKKTDTSSSSKGEAKSA